ncbi:MAG: hypothetical protein KI790_10910 [Cyclobacteriaceae bacterium]|nr:hypothetical protein [Cyclobacteriaceae bacterium HetDA_MAG_MS6]
MTDKYTQFLEKQVEKLEAEDFDLEAWKSSTIAALERLYGRADPRTRQIADLKIDYSSWALRDSNANYKPIETCKKKGREILKTAIEEVEIFGAPESKTADKNVLDKLPESVRKEVETMVKDSPKEKDLVKVFQKLKKETLAKALASLLKV